MIAVFSKNNYVRMLAKWVSARDGQQGDAFNPGGSRMGLATWGSSMLAWDCTGLAFVSVQAIIVQVSFFALLISSQIILCLCMFIFINKQLETSYISAEMYFARLFLDC